MAEILVKDMPVVLTKTSAKEIGSSLADRVNNGEVSALQVAAQISYIREALATAESMIKEAVMNEAERYGEKRFVVQGTAYEIKETGVRYDYSADAEWNDLNETMNQLKAQMKGRETMLKAMKMAAKSSTTSVCITLSK